ncbi:MAG: MaoC family dehydratase [Betaproteobacteria bacterium]|nr:MaoC family dehydratase [Betaproteobacteria bacterium]
MKGNADLKNFVGRDLPPGDWVEVTQEMIDKFADATGDHQWIHVDVERAKKESPYKTTIAHGYLTLSLMPELRAAALDMPPGRMGINYGLNKVRFTGPVPAGSRLRAVLNLAAVEELPDHGVQMQWSATVYREGADKPILVAETLVRRFE